MGVVESYNLVLSFNLNRSTRKVCHRRRCKVIESILLSTKWDSIRLGGPAHGRVTKTVTTCCQGLFCMCLELGLVQIFQSDLFQIYRTLSFGVNAVNSRRFKLTTRWAMIGV